MSMQENNRDRLIQLASDLAVTKPVRDEINAHWDEVRSELLELSQQLEVDNIISPHGRVRIMQERRKRYDNAALREAVIEGHFPQDTFLYIAEVNPTLVRAEIRRGTLALQDIQDFSKNNFQSKVIVQNNIQVAPYHCPLCGSSRE